MTASRVLDIILLAWLPASAAAQRADQEDSVYISHTHGFQIARPDDSWSFHETPDAPGGYFQLSLAQGSDWRIQITVRAKLLDKPSEPRAVLEQTLAEIRGKPGYSNSSTDELTIAGRKAPILIVDRKYNDEAFRVRQGYVVEDGMLYTLQCHAPVEVFETHVSIFNQVWSTFGVLPLSEETKREQRVCALAGRCGSEIEWAAGWEDAAKKAGIRNRLVLVVVRFLPGFNISDELAAGPFMDSDVVELVRERFVAFRFEKGMDAPFVAQDQYGMGPSTFGSSVLLATPAGEVVADTFAKDAFSLYAFLLEHVGVHGDSDAQPPPEDRKGLGLAEWHLRRGEFERAAQLLKDSSSARAHRLKASLLRRRRQGAQALGELRLARQAKGNNHDADLDMDQAVILLRMGKYAEAEKILRRFATQHPAGAHTPEAMFWLGASSLKTAGAEQAETWWHRLIDAQPENRWAWKAAAALRSTAFSMGLGERLEWPAEDALALLRAREFQSLDISNARQAERDAVTFLLRGQRPNGSWISPPEVARSTDEPDEFAQAITAICAQSLLAHRDQPACAAAIRRAIRFLLSERQREKALDGDRPYFMDYKVWSKAYTLWLMADCLRAGLGEPDEVRTTMDELVLELRDRQKDGGGWSYYVTRDLRTAGQPYNQSISFVTAAVLLSLLEARDAGIAVPEAMTDAAAQCLERMRNPNGTFEYMLHHDNEEAPRRTLRPGAAGRGPLCALVLHRAGRAEVDDLCQALDIFMAHRRTYAKEKGKSLMHAGPDGQGSHYLMFDYAFAAAAIHALPAAERARYRAPLLEQILDARGDDGSYIDNPIIGRHYATGMALIAFHHLQPL